MFNKMKARRLLVVILLLCLLGGFIVVVVVSRAQVTVSREVFDRITPDMSQKDVRKVLDCAPGIFCGSGAEVKIGDAGQGESVYVTLPEFKRLMNARREGFGDESKLELWIGHSGAVSVIFHESGEILDAEFFDVASNDFGDRFRRWLASWCH